MFANMFEADLFVCVGHFVVSSSKLAYLFGILIHHKFLSIIWWITLTEVIFSYIFHGSRLSSSAWEYEKCWWTSCFDPPFVLRCTTTLVCMSSANLVNTNHNILRFIVSCSLNRVLPWTVVETSHSKIIYRWKDQNYEYGIHAFEYLMFIILEHLTSYHQVYKPKLWLVTKSFVLVKSPNWTGIYSYILCYPHELYTIIIYHILSNSPTKSPCL